MKHTTNFNFKGQYSDEKLLLKKHENIISFLLNKLHIFIIYLVLAISIYFITKYITENNILSIFLAFFLLLIGILYLRFQYKNTWMIITSKRVLKLVKSSLFIDHRRELKLVDIKATLIRRNILNSLFGFGNIEVEGTDNKSNIYFRGIKGHEDIVNYLSKIIDIAKTNPDKIEDIYVYLDRAKGKY